MQERERVVFRQISKERIDKLPEYAVEFAVAATEKAGFSTDKRIIIGKKIARQIEDIISKRRARGCEAACRVAWEEQDIAGGQYTRRFRIGRRNIAGGNLCSFYIKRPEWCR